MSVTIPKDRGGGKAAAPARDRFLSPSQGFYTWFNMLPVEFGSILHSGLPRHSHFKSNCWPGRTTWEKAVVLKKIYSKLLKSLAFLSVGINVNDIWSSAIHYLNKQSVGSLIFIAKQEINAAFFSMFKSITAFNQNGSNGDLLLTHSLLYADAAF